MWPEQKRSGHILFQIVSRAKFVTLCAHRGDVTRARDGDVTHATWRRARAFVDRACFARRVSA
jgi:hypothetical protein